MSKVTLVAMALCLTTGLALVETLAGWNGIVAMPGAETQTRNGDCTTSEDAHGNVVRQCGTGNRASFDPRDASVVEHEAGTFAVSLPGNAWHTTLDDGDAIEQVLVTYRPDGSYVQVIRVPQLNRVIQVWGSYDLSPTSATEATLTVQPAGWQPQQMCGPNRCQTLSFTGETVELRAVDENTVETKDGLSHRVPIAAMRQAMQQPRNVQQDSRPNAGIASDAIER